MPPGRFNTVPPLSTPEQVIARADAAHLSADYVGLEPMADCAGFAIRRNYPETSALAKALKRDGTPIAVCIVQFVVDPPTAAVGVSRVRLHTFMFNTVSFVHRLLFRLDHNPDDPNGPSPDSLDAFHHARKPLDLNFMSEYVYDAGADQFQDENGAVVTTQQMIDRAYGGHCKTLTWGFALRWNIRLIIGRVPNFIVWRGQDLASLALFSLYDVEYAVEERTRWSPFYRYSPADFRRSDTQHRSDFFGFRSSPRAFLTNLIVVSIVVVLTYRYARDLPFVRAVHKNDALTTAALVLGFLLADLCGPWILIRMICLLSMLKPYVLPGVRQVRGV